MPELGRTSWATAFDARRRSARAARRAQHSTAPWRHFVRVSSTLPGSSRRSSCEWPMRDLSRQNDHRDRTQPSFWVEDLRLIGSASSLLRGVDLPVGDIDVLAKSRPTVEAMSQFAEPLGATPVEPAHWAPRPWGGQYIAELNVDGVSVEFSTVEGSSTRRLVECFGDAPWSHFSTIDVDGVPIRVVAPELRLGSELSRRRRDRWEPIAESLGVSGYDNALLQAATVGLPEGLLQEMREVLQRT